MNHTDRISLLLFVGLLGAWIAHVNGIQAGDATGQKVAGYSSPQEAFNACRDADARGDWRASFACLTQKARDRAIVALFESGCFRQHDPKMVATMAKHGLDLDSVQSEYSKVYANTHRTDSGRNGKSSPRVPSANSGDLKDPVEPANSIVDAGLMSVVVLRLVKDKAGFYEEASRAVYPKSVVGTSAFGVLEDLRITGDTAKGTMRVTSHAVVSGTATPARREDFIRRQTVQFRRVDGRWFVGE